MNIQMNNESKTPAVLSDTALQASQAIGVDPEMFNRLNNQTNGAIERFANDSNIDNLVEYMASPSLRTCKTRKKDGSTLYGNGYMDQDQIDESNKIQREIGKGLAKNMTPLQAKQISTAITDRNIEAGWRPMVKPSKGKNGLTTLTWVKIAGSASPRFVAAEKHMAKTHDWSTELGDWVLKTPAPTEVNSININ